MYKETEHFAKFLRLQMLPDNEIGKKLGEIIRPSENSRFQFECIGYIVVDITDMNIWAVGDARENSELYFPIFAACSETQEYKPEDLTMDPISGDLDHLGGLVTQKSIIIGIPNAVYKKPTEEYSEILCPPNAPNSFYVHLIVTDEHPLDPEIPPIITVDSIPAPYDDDNPDLKQSGVPIGVAGFFSPDGKFGKTTYLYLNRLG